jgi:vanillate O-demethylase monooxygenase subunit
MEGAPVALDSRCVHRYYPLSRGTLDGDNVVCGYHGFTFDPCGTCVYVPAQQRIPPLAKLRKYPVVERAPWVWVWMGDPALADESRVPDHHWLSDPGWTHSRGYVRIRANYLMMHENLLDLTHFTYLHAGNVGTPEWAETPLVVEVEGDRVRSTRVLENSLPPGLYAGAMGVTGHLVDRSSVTEWDPTLIVAHATIRDREPSPGAQEVFNVEILHALTPESPTSMHYFFALARNFALDDEAVTKHLLDSSLKAFQEDRVALEAVQDLVDRDHRKQLRAVSTVADRAGNALLHIMARLAAAEKTGI